MSVNRERRATHLSETPGNRSTRQAGLSALVARSCVPATPNQGCDDPILSERADGVDDRHHDEYQQGHHDRRDEPRLHRWPDGKSLSMTCSLLTGQHFPSVVRGTFNARTTQRIGVCLLISPSLSGKDFRRWPSARLLSRARRERQEEFG